MFLSVKNDLFMFEKVQNYPYFIPKIATSGHSAKYLHLTQSKNFYQIVAQRKTMSKYPRK